MHEPKIWEMSRNKKIYWLDISECNKIFLVVSGSWLIMHPVSNINLLLRTWSTFLRVWCVSSCKLKHVQNFPKPMLCNSRTSIRTFIPKTANSSASFISRVKNYSNLHPESIHVHDHKIRILGMSVSGTVWVMVPEHFIRLDWGVKLIAFVTRLYITWVHFFHSIWNL